MEPYWFSNRRWKIFASEKKFSQWKKFHYILSQIILALWLVLTYHLLEDRLIDDVIDTVVCLLDGNSNMAAWGSDTVLIGIFQSRTCFLYFLISQVYFYWQTEKFEKFKMLYQKQLIHVTRLAILIRHTLKRCNGFCTRCKLHKTCRKLVPLWTRLP